MEGGDAGAGQIKAWCHCQDGCQPHWVLLAAQQVLGGGEVADSNHIWCHSGHSLGGTVEAVQFGHVRGLGVGHPTCCGAEVAGSGHIAGRVGRLFYDL